MTAKCRSSPTPFHLIRRIRRYCTSSTERLPRRQPYAIQCTSLLYLWLGSGMAKLILALTKWLQNAASLLRSDRNLRSGVKLTENSRRLTSHRLYYFLLYYLQPASPRRCLVDQPHIAGVLFQCRAIVRKAEVGILELAQCSLRVLWSSLVRFISTHVP